MLCCNKRLKIEILRFSCGAVLPTAQHNPDPDLVPVL